MSNALAPLNIEPKIELTLGSVTLNNKQDIENLLSQSKKYKGMVIKDKNDVKFVYSTRSNLNKMMQAIDRKRIDTKNEMYEPIKQFEAEMNGLKAIVEETHKDLDATYKAYEQRIKDEKQAEINKAIEELSDGHDIEHNPKWLTKSYDMETVRKDIVAFVEVEKARIAKFELEQETVRQTAEMNGLPADSYLQLLAFKDVLDVVNDIVQAGVDKQKREAAEAERQAQIEAEETERRAQQEAEKAERNAQYEAELQRIRTTAVIKEVEPSPVEVIDEVAFESEIEPEVEVEIEVEQDETGELFTRVAQFTATKSQLKMIHAYAQSIGVDMLPHKCSDVT